jgi:simple sugar transport system ATP-binding protein
MLELRQITKRFGEVLANDHVEIVVKPGTIHAIVGENGAGKSTAMRIADGFYTADSGEILIDGQVRNINSPHDAIALGVGMVHQHFMLVETMTVAENIVLGAEPGTTLALDLKRAALQIRQLSEEFKLAVNPNEPIEHLSVGQQQRVELLKALYRHARLLILDEPTAVLTPLEVEEFFPRVSRYSLKRFALRLRTMVSFSTDSSSSSPSLRSNVARTLRGMTTSPRRPIFRMSAMRLPVAPSP